MTYHGHIESGQVVFDQAVRLPEGTEVTVFVNGAKPTGGDKSSSSLFDRMKPIIGIAPHLPPDASTKIDEVLHFRESN